MRSVEGKRWSRSMDTGRRARFLPRDGVDLAYSSVAGIHARAQVEMLWMTSLSARPASVSS